MTYGLPKSIPEAKFLPEGKIKEIIKSIYKTYVYLTNPIKVERHTLAKGIYEYSLNGLKLLFGEDEYTELFYPLRGYIRFCSIKEGDIVVDGGAFNGVFSVYAGKIVGEKGKVYAFEPNPRNMENLDRNLRLNNLNNVVIVKEGLWNKKTTLSISNEESLSSVFSKSNDRIEIEVTSLDYFAQKNNIKGIDFIKMDIEGAEIQALEGAEEVLEKLNPFIAVASYHVVNGKKTYKEVEDRLRAAGYKAWTASIYHPTTYAKKRKRQDAGNHCSD